MNQSKCVFWIGGVQSFPANLTMIGFLDLQPSNTISQPDRCFVCNEQKQSRKKIKLII